MLETGRIFSLVVLIATSLLIYLALTLQKRGIVKLEIRPLPPLDAIDEAISSAAERGRPVIFVPRGGPRATVDVPQVAPYLSVLSKVATKCAELNVPLIIVYSDAEAEVGPLISERAREGFVVGGRPELFQADTIRFYPLYTYTMGTMGTIGRERPGACIYMGSYYHEAVIYGETGQSVGAMQIAGTANTHQMPFFVTTCDYTLLGEEYLAAGAYISKDPVQVGSIGGQDWGKILAVLLTIIGVITVSIGYVGFVNLLKM